MIVPGLGVSLAEARGLDDTSLAEALTDLSLALRGGGAERYVSLAAAANLPLAEVVASPFAIRAVAMAVAVGSSTAHHELRVAVPWPDRFATQDAVATDAHGYWDAGTLQAGKYRGFTQDEPFAVFNPNHMSKWGPHELMHRACGFVWRRDLTRWEAYLGARLNELLPVVLWYGLDEVARLNRDGFDRDFEAKNREARLEDCLWLTETDDALRVRIERGVKHFREGVAHFDRELTAIDAELEIGRPVRAPHPFLDSSSDAIAYVVGHLARLRDPMVTAMMETVLVEGRDFTGSVLAYREEILDTFERLVGAPIELNDDLTHARRCGRHVWDLAHRAAHHERARVARLEPAFSLAGEVLTECWNGDTSRYVEAIDGLIRGLPSSAARTATATGHGDREDSGSDATRDQVLEGLSSVAPAVAAQPSSGALIEDLIVSRELWSRRPLADRVDPMISQAGSEIAELWRFERAIVESTVRDDLVERIGCPVEELPEDLSSGRVHASSAFTLFRFDGDPVRAHAAWQEGEQSAPSVGATAWLIGNVLGAVSVVPAPPAVADAWEAIRGGATDTTDVVRALDRVEPEEGLPASGSEWFDELVAAGAIAWVPSPR